MLISHRRKFIFIHVYKNAGTSISNALLPFAAPAWNRELGRVTKRLHIGAFGPQPYPIHISASELVEKIGRETFDSYFSFAIVRNPWAWQVSLYEYARKDPRHFQHALTRSFADFNEYIRWRIPDEVRQQKSFICSDEGELLVDFVGRFETLEADFDQACSRIGISASLPRLNVSTPKPYQEYYTDETRELVRQAFQTDIDYFNYDF